MFYICILVSLTITVSDHLSYARDTDGWEKETDLVFVEGPLDIWEEHGKKVASVRIGSATLNSHYFDWALKYNWTLPSNTIQHLMTIGGVATPMCHGAGIAHKTISDRILKIGKFECSIHAGFMYDNAIGCILVFIFEI